MPRPTSSTSPSSDEATAAMRPPSLGLWLRETVSIAELGAYAAAMPWWRLAPRGRGAPVWVLPGLTQSDRSTRPLRWFLAERGHAVYAWNQGLNRGRSGIVEEQLLPRLLELHAKHGQPVSIVGWSMGGLYARELAKLAPQAVRQVITLGSPFAGDPKASNAWRMYQWLSGERAGDPTVGERYAGPLPVPTTAIYSRKDGIVAWPCCINPPAAAGEAPTENIEVVSSHLGLGHHPAVLYAVAERLARPDAPWVPFAPRDAVRWMYPKKNDQNTTTRAQETHHESGKPAEPEGAHRPRHRGLARPRLADGRGAG